MERLIQGHFDLGDLKEVPEEWIELRGVLGRRHRHPRIGEASRQGHFNLDPTGTRDPEYVLVNGHGDRYPSEEDLQLAREKIEKLQDLLARGEVGAEFAQLKDEIEKHQTSR